MAIENRQIHTFAYFYLVKTLIFKILYTQYQTISLNFKERNILL